MRFSRITSKITQNKQSLQSLNHQNNSSTKIIKRDAHYHADNQSFMSSSHEQSQNNPFIQKHGYKNGKSPVFQHPAIGRDTCSHEYCKDKICNTPCSTVVQKEYVGMCTHSEKYGQYVSPIDLNDQERTQYYKPYKEPVLNYDTTGDNVNQQKTTMLNNNSEMLFNIHNLTNKD